MSILIQGGTIVDGSGNAPFTGDIFIEGNVIKSAGAHYTGAADELIYAGGKVVCPGFIDLHRHCDTAALADNFGLIEISQGITSCFTGNCGMAPVPNRPETRPALQNYLDPCLGDFSCETFRTPAEYAARLRSAPLPINIGFYAGMGAIRIACKGFDSSPFTPAQMEEARAYLRESLDCGAAGMSIGLMYVPEAYCSTSEIAALARVMNGSKGILCAHMRWETEHLVKAVREVITIAKEAGVPLEISHFKAAGIKAWGGILREAIDLIESERARGCDITVDFYPYDCGSSTMLQMLPPSYLAGGLEESIAGLCKSANIDRIRKLLVEGEPGWDNLSQTIGWDRTIVSSAGLAENKKFIGKTVTACAREFGFSDEVEFVAQLLYSENGKVSIINRSMSQDDIDTIARLPYSSLISDALYGPAQNPHPRLYGAFPRFLRAFVRERNVLDLPTAIRKMTSQPAARAGLPSRGLLRPGYHADVIVFDSANFQDNADYSAAAQISSGLDYAIIGGRIVYHAGKLLCRNAGSVLQGARPS
ncbi:MAG: amidohydrolase family protein [Spirochaetaceae bacterium]|jgi:N-acyl-D-amino-acid deacylase|nr:amidohydrolase family protein [Spirochaetaceae bacterium]